MSSPICLHPAVSRIGMMRAMHRLAIAAGVTILLLAAGVAPAVAAKGDACTNSAARKVLRTNGVQPAEAAVRAVLRLRLPRRDAGRSATRRPVPSGGSSRSTSTSTASTTRACGCSRGRGSAWRSSCGPARAAIRASRRSTCARFRAQVAPRPCTRSTSPRPERASSVGAVVDLPARDRLPLGEWHARDPAQPDRSAQRAPADDPAHAPRPPTRDLRSLKLKGDDVSWTDAGSSQNRHYSGPAPR